MAHVTTVNVHGDDNYLTPDEFTVHEYDSYDPFLTIEVGEAVALFIKDADGLSAIIAKLEAERQRLITAPEAAEAVAS